MLDFVRKSLEFVLGLCYNKGRNKERVKNMNEEPMSRATRRAFGFSFIFFL